MKTTTHLAAMALAACCATATLAYERVEIGAPENATYAKECGSCHVAFVPGLLPERSWRRIMGSLSSHFGDNAEAKSADVEEITRYLAQNAADHGVNVRSRAIVASIPPGETPLRITETPYVAGIHGGLLDPAFQGVPHVKSLSECAACHPRADRGSFAVRRYVITDEAFRPK
jgi:hypothetical protein